MTAIAPNTIIRCGQVGLMMNNEDTFYFPSVQAQTTFFANNLTHEFTKFTYQREHRNFVKIEITSEQQADTWDYMMFQNTSYGDKWFYAFITQTEWINNLTVKLYYEIDYIQTYWNEYNEGDCFIERQHEPTDDIGDNIVPESLELGEYVFNVNLQQGQSEIFENLSDTTYAIFILADDDGQKFDNVYVGGKVYAYNTSNVSGINSFVSQHTQRQDIIAAYIVPGAILSRYTIDPNTHEITNTNASWYNEYTAYPVNNNTRLDNYLPENKKLLTYPYNFYYITDNSGNNLALRYEFFTDKTPHLVGGGSASAPPFLSFWPDPSYYKAQAPNSQFPWAPTFEKITISGFPMVMFTYDSFRSWGSRVFTTQTIKKVASSVVGAVAGGMLMGPVGAVMGAMGASVATMAATRSQSDYTAARATYQMPAEAAQSTGSYIGSSLSGAYQASIESDIFKGSFNGGSTPITWEYDLQGIRVSINRHYAEMIDNYFTMYGYAHKRIGTPSRHNRQRFTYVKTIDAYIYGELPAEAKAIIASKYNRGIRFWVTDGRFRDYTASNPPLS